MGGDWNREKTEAKVGSCGGAGSPWGGFAAGAVVDSAQKCQHIPAVQPSQECIMGCIGSVRH